MSVRDNLIAARALIDTPEKWNNSGSFGSDGCFCAIGALEWSSGEWRNFIYYNPESAALWRALPDDFKLGSMPSVVDVFAYNDDAAEHADIMALYDRAIEAAGDK